MKLYAVTAREAREARRERASGPKTARCFRAGRMLSEMRDGIMEADRHLLRARRVSGSVQEKEILTAAGSLSRALASGALSGETRLGFHREARDFAAAAREAERFVIGLSRKRVEENSIAAAVPLMKQVKQSARRLIDAAGKGCRVDPYRLKIGI